MKKLFDTIELMLFDDYDKGPSHMYLECKEWISVFPHLRLVMSHTFDQLVLNDFTFV